MAPRGRLERYVITINFLTTVHPSMFNDVNYPSRFHSTQVLITGICRVRYTVDRSNKVCRRILLRFERYPTQRRVSPSSKKCVMSMVVCPSMTSSLLHFNFKIGIHRYEYPLYNLTLFSYVQKIMISITPKSYKL